MSTYDEALRYTTELNWSLVWIPYSTKGQKGMDPEWNSEGAGLKTPKQLERLKSPCNIGLHHWDSGTVSIDIDDESSCRILFSEMGLDYDKLMSGAPRIVSRPGKDKAIFKRPDNLKLTYSDDSKAKSVFQLKWPNKDGKGYYTVFEIRTWASQDILPPSIHPDTNAPYTWGKSPYEDIPELPVEFAAIWNEWDKFEHQLKSACPWGPIIEPKKPKAPRLKFGKVGEDAIARYNQAHDIRALLSDYGYEKMGMRFRYPYSKTKVPGVIVFNDNTCFSHHGTDPLGDGHAHDCFDLFCQFEYSGDIKEAIAAAKKELNIRTVEYDPEAIEHGKSVAETLLKKTTVKPSDNLISIPGVLQLAVDYYQSTALKPQPEYAVAAALAIGAVCLSRQWRSSQNNYTALYFLMLGKSSTGKEHGKTVIENVLRASGESCLKLIGPPGYTSAGAIITTLKHQPRHICIQDEMGKQLQHAMAAKNSQKDAAYTMIMEIFGRQSGFISSDAYSNLSGKHRDDLESTTIDRPGLTIFGISTPSTLYKAIDSDSISSGYLPRFLIIESTAERELSRWIDDDIPVPPDLIEWCRNCAEMTGDTGNLSAYTDPPEPKTVRFNSACRVMLDDFEREIISIQNGLDAFGISELWGRVKEISMRVALIVAISCESDEILPEHLDWAMRYVKKHFTHTTDRVRQVVSNSDYEAVCKEVLTIINRAGVRGATTTEIYKKSGLFRALDKKAGECILSTLSENEGVVFDQIIHAGGGRPRFAWVCHGDAE